MILPYDILGLIIEELGREKSSNAALLATAQTCKEISSLCQAQLFKEITIWNSNSKRFGIVFNRSRKLIPVLACSLRLAKLVSSLSLCFDHEAPGGTAYYDLSQALDNMTAVKSLYIDLFYGNWPTKEKGYTFMLQRLLRRPSLVDLKLHRVENLKVADLLLCSNLQHLSLDEVSGAQSIGSMENISGGELHSRITVPELNVHRIEASLLRNPSDKHLLFLNATSLRRVSSFYDASNNQQCLRTLFEQSPYIEELALSTYCLSSPCLSGLTDMLEQYRVGLKKLTLAYYSFDSDRSSKYRGLWTEVEILSKSSGPQKTIEDINLTLKCEGEDPVIPEASEWQQLHAALIKPHAWPSLKLVTLAVKYEYPEETGLNEKWDAELRGVVGHFTELSEHSSIEFHFQYSTDYE